MYLYAKNINILKEATCNIKSKNNLVGENSQETSI